MTATIKNIKCPKCEASINVNEVLSKQIKDSVKLEIEKNQNELKKREIELKEKQSNLDILIFEKSQELHKRNLDESRLKIQEEYKSKIETYQKELDLKNKSIKKLYEIETENEKLKRNLELVEVKTKSALTKKFIQEAKENEEELKRKIEEDYAQKVRELEERLNDQKKLNEEQRRKLNQGSVQLQGEVQELIIEEWLRCNFPSDEIREIKKGQNGADIVHVINPYKGINDGIIYIESKNTKVFQNSWVKKIKKDSKEINADVNIIITKAMPNGKHHFTIVDGVYICTLSHFKIICELFRESVVKLKSFKVAQENKSDKVVKLYDYLMSPGFKNLLIELVNGFIEQEELLVKEKRAITANWKKRELHNEVIRNNISNLYMNINSIGGHKIASIPEFEIDLID